MQGRHTWIHQLSENWQLSRLMVSIIRAFWGDLCQHPVSNCHPMSTRAPEIIMTPAEPAVSCSSIFVRWINHRSDISATWKNFRLQMYFQVEIDAKQVLSPFLVTLELQGVIEADFSLDTHVRICENTCQTALQVNLQWRAKINPYYVVTKVCSSVVFNWVLEMWNVQNSLEHLSRTLFEFNFLSKGKNFFFC